MDKISWLNAEIKIDDLIEYKVKMIKIVKWTLTIIFVNFLFFSITFACRYTVREIGFADIAPTPYHLYFYKDNNVPEDLPFMFEQISQAALLDANIVVEIVNVAKQLDHPAMEFFHQQKPATLPVVILVSPTHQPMVIPFSQSTQSFKEAVWLILEELVFSPIRSEIQQRIVKAFAIVLLIEGKDTDKNRNAKVKAEQAIQDLRKIMKQLPKPVTEQPGLIVISQQDIALESTLLWSLGLSGWNGLAPVIAVLYGRGRKIGPLLTGDQITENRIFNLLTVVGSDCECGLDRSWILGTMIPLRWHLASQKELVKRLGFDPENPLIKAEMSQILAVDPGEGKIDNPLDNNILSYRESIVEFQNTGVSSAAASSQNSNLSSPDSGSATGNVPKIIWLSLIIIIFLVLTGGGLILSRVGKKK